MTRTAITTGSRFEEMAGYSRAVIDGEWVFISGTAGHDHKAGTIAGDAAGQARQSLKTIEETLAQADATFADVVQVRVYLADRADVEAVSLELGKCFAPPRPTNTTIICGFPVEEIKVEIEMTALKRR